MPLRRVVDRGPFVRTVYGLSKVATSGVPFTATLTDSPRAGQYWEIEHIAVELLNYAAGGLVRAVLTVGGRYVASTNQGQHDSFDAGRTVVRVNESELVVVTWDATHVTTALVAGRITATVAQHERG